MHGGDVVLEYSVGWIVVLVVVDAGGGNNGAMVSSARDGIKL